MTYMYTCKSVNFPSGTKLNILKFKTANSLSDECYQWSLLGNAVKLLKFVMASFRGLSDFNKNRDNKFHCLWMNIKWTQIQVSLFVGHLKL